MPTTNRPTSAMPTSNRPTLKPIPERTMRLTSPAFVNGSTIPPRYTCDGDDVSPALDIEDIPPGTESLMLIVEDPDAPRGTWDHWVAYDIAPISHIPEANPDVGTPGRNSWGRLGYGGPCPPSGTHRYVFRVLALDRTLGLPSGATKAEVLEAAHGHVLAEAVLVGLYGR